MAAVTRFTSGSTNNSTGKAIAQESAHALWLVSLFAMMLALAAMFIPRPLQRRFNQKKEKPTFDQAISRPTAFDRGKEGRPLVSVVS